MEGIDLSTLRAVINCSEPMHWKSHAMFLERFQPYGLRPAALATSYAMAENVFAVTQGGIQEPVTVDTIDLQALLKNQVARPVSPALSLVEQAIDPVADGYTTTVKMLSAGRPIDGTRLRVLDVHGKDLPDRRIGEIALQSNCMLTGYYHRPDLTEKAFRDGWYLTGDLGYLAEGELYVTGRIKDLIIVGGKNIYPQDLERLASEVEGVHPGRVVAFGVFNEQSGTEDVIMIAEVDDENAGWQLGGRGGSSNKTEIIAAEIRQKVTRGSDIALRNVHIVGRNWLVKTSSGKVARSANREKYLAELADR
jgi:acyl-CoA synthetase (AMP-forming)/AMP-acid ligase II